MDTLPLREQILQTIIRKTTLKQRVFDNTFAAFNLLKETLLEFTSELDDALDGKLDRRVRLEYRDRGKFEAQLQVGSEMLIFQMQTDVFAFDPARGYCGAVRIYNFLSDSFKFNRNADEGYLIGRLFINGEGRYFVEGRGFRAVPVERFGERSIDRAALVELLEEAIAFALDFDPYVPPYAEHLRVTVDQFNTKMDNSKFVTGKRIGYPYEV